jgi:DNA-binding NtrC family response regulator
MTAPTILLIDDEPLLLNSLERLLEDDFFVLKTTKQMHAIELAQKYQPVVVISDQRMPGMLGHQLLECIKTISPKTMRILLTGYADLEATVGSMNYSEVFRYISKPWKADKLLETVHLAASIYARMEEVEQDKLKGINKTSITPSVLVVCNQLSEIDEVSKGLMEYQIKTASSAGRAILHLQEEEIAVLLLIGISDSARVSEIEFLSLVRRISPETVPIFLSNGTDKETALRLINESSTFRYLSKSIRSQDLNLIVRQAVAQHEWLKAHPLKNRHRIEEELADWRDRSPPPKTLNELIENLRKRNDEKSNY